MKKIQQLAEDAGYTMVEFAEWSKDKYMMYKFIFNKPKKYDYDKKVQKPHKF